MKSTILLKFFAVCNLCWLVTSLPAYSELTERDIGESLADDVERALDTLDQVFQRANRMSSQERRFWDLKLWDTKKNYTNIKVGKLELGKRQPMFFSSDVNRPSLRFWSNYMTNAG